VWGVILVRVSLKKIFYQAQMGTARDLIFRKCRNNKDGLFSFQARLVKTDKF
jgi:hypothetical protein